MKTYKYLTIIFTLICFKLYSNDRTKIVCSHIQICNLAKKLILDQKKLSFNSIYSKGDPHHFSPSSKDKKLLQDADIVLLAPFELASWIKPLIDQDKQTKYFKALNGVEADFNLAHFWIDPKTYCEVSNNLFHFLKKKALKLRQYECDFETTLKKLDQIKLQLKQTYFVFSHSPFASLFARHELKCLNLITGDHHHELTSSTLKKVVQLIKSKNQIIWVNEKGIANSQILISKYKRAADKVVTIDPIQLNATSNLIDQILGLKESE